jgi:hypothetical protein
MYTTENPLKLSQVPGFTNLIVSLKDWSMATTNEPIDVDDGSITFLSLHQIKEISSDEKGKYIIFREEHDDPYTKAYPISYWIESKEGRWTTGLQFLTL